MEKIISVSGMTCEACEYKINHLFGGIEGVKSVEIDRNKNQVKLQLTKNIDFKIFQEVLKPFPKYQVFENSIQTITEEEKTWFQTYQPLFLVFFFITIVSFLSAFHQNNYQISHFNAMHFMNNFMAGFFLVFSFFKLLNIKQFAESYAMYDLLAMKVPLYGIIYPFIEFALGIAYLTHFNPFFTNVSTIIIMGFSTIGVIKSVMDNKKIRCACLGSVFNLPMSTLTIIEDLLMVVMAVFMIRYEM